LFINTQSTARWPNTDTAQYTIHKNWTYNFSREKSYRIQHTNEC